MLDLESGVDLSMARIGGELLFRRLTVDVGRPIGWAINCRRAAIDGPMDLSGTEDVPLHIHEYRG